MPKRSRPERSGPRPQPAHNGQWYANIGPPRADDPRNRSTKVYAPKNVVTEAQAWKWLDKELERRESRKIDTHDPTVYGLCQLYLKWAEARAAENLMTKGQYKTLCSRLSLFWDTVPSGGDRPFKNQLARSIEPADVDAAIEVWRQAGYAPHYRKGIIRAIRSAYRWGARKVPGRARKLLAEDPLDGYQAPRLPKAPDRYVDPVVVRRFLRWAWGQARQLPTLSLKRRFDRLYLLALRFAFLTGCRPGEAVRLKWSHVRWDDDLVFIPPPEQKTGKKTDEPREIELTRPVRRLLRAVEKLERRHEVYVFPHMRSKAAARVGADDPMAGEPWPSGSAASQKLRKLRQDAIDAKVKGVQKTGARKLIQYTARHDYASQALMRGMTTSEAAKLLGNTATMVEQTYGHIQNPHRAKLAQKMVERSKGKTPDEADQD